MMEVASVCALTCRLDQLSAPRAHAASPAAAALVVRWAISSVYAAFCQDLSLLFLRAAYALPARAAASWEGTEDARHDGRVAGRSCFKLPQALPLPAPGLRSSIARRRLRSPVLESRSKPVTGPQRLLGPWML